MSNTHTYSPRQEPRQGWLDDEEFREATRLLSGNLRCISALYGGAPAIRRLVEMQREMDALIMPKGESAHRS